MIGQVSEKKMHTVRLMMVFGWLVLILSLFYDPISPYLTDPNNLMSPFRNAYTCVLLQGECLEAVPYPMGSRIFWSMVVPSAVLIVLVLGHETWRRICPLYFLSQIPRALGIKPLLKIKKNKWLLQNHLYLQFALLFIGLNVRILLISSDQMMLGLFLLLTIAGAMLTVTLYGGRSWCHYVCPFGVVQMVFTGPRGLLGQDAHTAPRSQIPQSECRTVASNQGKEKSACVGCKMTCMDKDAEKSYWHSLTQPGRKFVQYGYLGLVIGFFLYYGLCAGNFEYYYSGAWTHQPDSFATLLAPGFYLFGQPIGIPKLVACPLTLGLSVVISYIICTKLEKAYRAALIRNNSSMSPEQVMHRMFSLCSFLAFNFFFIYGGRSEMMKLPVAVQFLLSGLIVAVSSLWLYRSWNRSAEQYHRESLIHSFRRQLQKLPIDLSQVLEGRSLEQLTVDELYVLAKVLPNATRQDRLQVYKGVLQEELEQGRCRSVTSLETLTPIREKLGLSEEEHHTLLTEIGGDQPHLLYSPQSPYVITVDYRFTMKH